MSFRDQIFYNVQPFVDSTNDKISIIGAGVVGTALAVCILSKKVTNNLVIVDPFSEKVKGEVLDFQHGILFLKNPRIRGGTNFSLTQGSKICIITSGVKRDPNETRIDLAQRNSDIMTKLIPEIIKHSPSTIILMVGNPCDVLTYVAWKISGLPHYKVIGAGTTLDTQRFRVLLARKFQTDPANVHGWVIGEHGENSIPLWSSVNISGTRIKDINPLIGTEIDPENWLQIHQEVVEASKVVEELKGYCSWGVAMGIAVLAQALLHNKSTIHPVSVNAKGKFGIETDVFMPLPAVLGSNGVYDIVHLNLSDQELQLVQETAELLKQVQDTIVIKGTDIDCKCRRCRT